MSHEKKPFGAPFNISRYTATSCCHAPCMMLLLEHILWTPSRKQQKNIPSKHLRLHGPPREWIQNFQPALHRFQLHAAFVSSSWPWKKSSAQSDDSLFSGECFLCGTGSAKRTNVHALLMSLQRLKMHLQSFIIIIKKTCILALFCSSGIFCCMHSCFHQFRKPMHVLVALLARMACC